MDEKTVAMVRGDGFSQLLECPHCSGVGCHIAVHNPPGLVFDNDQYVEQPQCCRHNDSEITGQYGRRMVAHKGGPALIATGLSVRAFGHLLAYRTGRNLDPELQQQLIGNTFLTPGHVTQSHFTDERAQLRWYPWSPWS